MGQEIAVVEGEQVQELDHPTTILLVESLKRKEKELEKDPANLGTPVICWDSPLLQIELTLEILTCHNNKHHNDFKKKDDLFIFFLRSKKYLGEAIIFYKLELKIIEF